VRVVESRNPDVAQLLHRLVGEVTEVERGGKNGGRWIKRGSGSQEGFDGSCSAVRMANGA